MKLINPPRWMAGVSVWGIVSGILSAVGGLSVLGGVAWWLLLTEERGEHEGNRDADEALEEIGGAGKKKDGKAKGKKEEKEKEKRKEDEGEKKK